MGKSLVVKSAVRAQLKGMRTGGDLFKALDEKVAHVLKHATERAKGNGRKTLRGVDL